MGLPRVSEARRYYRAAKQRFEDSEHLLAAGRTTGAVYLAGYTVECFIKALILASVSPSVRRDVIVEFRGNRGHDIEWLGDLYRRMVGGTIPREIARHLARIVSWSTNLRYETGLLTAREADEFVESVTTISNWAEWRM